MDSPYRFTDRADAGRRLALELEDDRSEHPLVLALPRGGVVVAAEVAHTLQAPLDVVVVRKLGAPFEPELAIGAIAPGDVILLDDQFQLSNEEVEPVMQRERTEMDRRTRRYRGTDGLPDVEGRTVLLVDDGLATGWTARAAARAVKKGHPRRVVLAVPVAPPDTLQTLAAEVDDVVCLQTVEPFVAVGQWRALRSGGRRGGRPAAPCVPRREVRRPPPVPVRPILSCVPPAKDTEPRKCNQQRGWGFVAERFRTRHTPFTRVLAHR